MATPLGAMKVELGLETNDFNSGLTSARRAVNYFKTEANALDKVLKTTGNNMQTLSAKSKSLKQAIEAQAKVLQNLKQKQDGLKEGSAAWEANAVAIERENAKLIDLESNLLKVEQAMKQAISQSGFTGWLQSAGDKLQTFGEKAEAFGNHFKGISAAAGLGLVAGAKAAIEFESAIAGVNKTVSGTPEQLKAVENGIRAMALEIPATTTEIAGVAEAAGQLGIATDDVLDFTRVMMELGTTTNMSAEEAATALAQFTNITGMSSDKIRNLADTIVDLGNNSATTEKDIVNLATRLAGAGTQVGLTEAEIMGLSAAMASVGLSAEAGGTAMSTIMTKINKAVANGGQALQNFANIAGVSADEFASKWKSSPTEALEMFTKGLGKALSEGKNIDQMLSELGVTGIRETDTIKRLAQAGDLMGDSFKRANEAFNNGGALATEAATRYETTESKLQLLKNKLNDVAIELGGPIVDALNSLVDASEPVLKTVSNLAKGFTNMPKGAQKAVVGLVALTAAISPVAIGLGKLTSHFGKTMSALGKFAGAIKVANQLKTMGSTATTASGAITTLGTATAGTSALLTGGLVVAGLAVGAGLVYVANKAGQAQEQIKTWGNVSKETASKLKELQTTSLDATAGIGTFGTQIDSVMAKSKESVTNLKNEIHSLADEKLSQTLKELSEAIADPKLFEQAKQEATEYFNKLKLEASTAAATINQIYDNASKNNRKISEDEKSVILQNVRDLTDRQIQLLDDGNKAKTELLKLNSGELVKLTDEQYRQVLDTTKNFIDEENRAYEKRVQNLKDKYQEGEISQKTYLESLKNLENEHINTIENYTNLQKTALASRLKDINDIYQKEGKSDKWLKTMTDGLKNAAKDMGLAWDDIVKVYENGGMKLANTSAKIKSETDEAYEALAKWNALELDPKTGKLDTSSVSEGIKTMVEAEGNWNSIDLMVKNLEIDSSGMKEVAQAVVQLDGWNQLTPEAKEILANASPALKAISSSEEKLEIWNSIPAEVKEILGNSANFMEAAGSAEQILEVWNDMSAEEKELLAKNLVGADTTEAQRMIEEVRQQHPANIEADNKTLPPTSSAKENLESVANGEYKAVINAEDRTEETKQSIWQKFTSLFQSDDTKVKITAQDRTQEAISQAKANIATIKQDSPVTLTAQNNTQAGVSSAQSTVDSLKQKSPASLKAKNDAKAGVSSAQSTINSLKGKTVDAKANAVGQSAVNSLKASIDALYNKTVTVTTVVREVKQKAKGDNNFEGGLAMVNDQKGSLYKEMITLPSGRSFIPEGRNVVMPLPKGTKILRASKTKQLMNNMGIPRFADGLGIPSDAKFMRDIERATVLPPKRRDSYLDTDRIVDGLTELETKVVRVLKALLNKDSTIVLDGAVLSEKITKRQTKSTRLANRMNGVVT